MNDILVMAEYCYNNCELVKTLGLLDRYPADAEAAVLRIKCLYELDKPAEATAFARAVQKNFPFHGLLHYQRGISLYLSGASTEEIEEAFTEALSLGCDEAHMGMAFLSYVAKDYAKAIGLLETASYASGESEHARMLKLFQIYLKREDLDAAEACLHQSRAVLARSPSLLRSLWSDLCLVRLLRARGQFETAKVNVDRLVAQISSERTPRLYRNAVEAEKLILAKDSGCHISMPRGEPKLDQAVLTAITRKPVLFCLYEFLRSCGRSGATKEDIINEVWNEAYNPMVHDDRLYKAVGRLRRLLGDDQAMPQALLLKGRNYVLNTQYTNLSAN